MRPAEFVRLARRLVPIPTAPFHEHQVRAEIEAICSQEGLECARDQFGNVHVRVQSDRKRRPVVLAAHMDHPGFEVVKRLDSRKCLVHFRGGVGEKYFKRGLGVRLFPGDIRATLGPRKNQKELVFATELKARSEHKFAFGIWDLPDIRISGDRLYARACDDLIGVCAVLATCIDLSRSKASVNVVSVLSRAEEVGFQGALALAETSSRAKGTTPRLLPKNSLVISLETSREMPPVKMGSGPIIRVGDRASIFHSEGTRFLSEVAADLSARDKQFKFQRALMSGGTCEATAYQEFGFDSVGMCVALGNYHNCGSDFRIKPEYVDVRDVCGMVAVLGEAARRIRELETLTGRLRTRLGTLLMQAKSRFEKEREP